MRVFLWSLLLDQHKNCILLISIGLCYFIILKICNYPSRYNFPWLFRKKTLKFSNSIKYKLKWCIQYMLLLNLSLWNFCINFVHSKSFTKERVLRLLITNISWTFSTICQIADKEYNIIYLVVLWNIIF